MPEQDRPSGEADSAPPLAADRLEAALERIARAATAEIIRAARDAPADPDAMPAAAMAARLDELIVQLRAVLAESA